MRTLTAAQSKILSLADRSTHMRVQIDRGSSDWVDLRDFEGYDWVHSVDYTLNQDDPIQRATIRLFRQAYDLNLAPLMDGSKLNQGGTIADLGNAIKVETATIAKDTQPASSDWIEVHRGEIDSVDWASPQIVIESSDNGGKLVRDFIESSDSAYGLAAGEPLEDVIQNILDDHANETTYLYSVNGTSAGLPGSAFNASDSPGFNIIPYNQDQQTVIAALRRVAQLIGAEVGYKWHDNTSAFQLVFQQPDRDTGAQGTLTLSGVTTAADTFVVNATTFTAVASGAGTDQWNVGATQKATAANIVKMFNAGTEKNNAYAYQASGDDVVITWTPGTAGNAITFTEASTHMTADGSGTLGGTTAGTDGNTTADYTFAADRYFDISALKITRQDIRNVVEVTFEDSNQVQRTVNYSDGPSIAKYGRQFMKLTEASGSQIDTFAEALDFAGAALADLSTPSIDKEVEAPYFWPAEIGDVYTYTANGQHYDTDQTAALVQVRHTLTRDSARTVFTVRGKPAGGKKRWLRIEGRPGIAPVSTAFIGPAHENRSSQSFDQLLRNSDLNIYTRGTNLPPDGWSVAGTVDEWGTSGSAYRIATGFTGNAAVAMAVTAANSTVALISDFKPIAAGDLLRVGIVALGDVVAASTDVDLQILWYDVDRAALSTSTTAITLNQSTYKPRQGGVHEAPTSARFCRVQVQVNRVAADWTAHIDKISLVRENARWSELASSVTAGSATLKTLDFNSGDSFRAGVSWSAANDEITIVEPGTYALAAISSAFYNSAVASVFNYSIEVQVDDGTGYSRLQGATQGSTQPAPSTRAAEAHVSVLALAVLQQGDKVRVQGTVANHSVGAVTSYAMNVFPGSSFQGQLLLRSDR